MNRAYSNKKSQDVKMHLLILDKLHMRRIFSWEKMGHCMLFQDDIKNSTYTCTFKKRTSKYDTKKLMKVKRKMGNFSIIVGDFKILL